ncbi:MAG: hypothetical protein IJ347_09290 [Faecalibacterium sp.]|nr:hypothetical protein [Faecalibacterium sp.]
MRSSNTKSWQIALCGVLGALALAVMQLGVVIPVAMYIAPAIASAMVMVVCVECGRRMAWTQYAAVALLSLLFVADREIAFVYLFLGYYPLIKPYFEKLRPRLLQGAAKLLYFNLTILVMYLLLYSLFFPGQLAAGLAGLGLALAAGTLLIGNIAFLLLDRALVNLLRLYRYVWQPRLHRMLGRR